MDRPVRNKKSVDYALFLDLENDDEDFASAAPVSKKPRVEVKKEKKENVTKKPKPETSSPKNSQGKRLPLDEKIYQRDLEAALALSVLKTSVIIENNEDSPRTVSPAFFPSESKDPEASFSNCSIDSSVLGLDEITEGNEEPVNARSRRQAASKAITEQRKLLKDDSSGEEDADEFKPESVVLENSIRDESYSDDDDDEEFDVKKSKKAAPKAKREKKGKNTPKARRKSRDSESDSFSDDEEFKVKNSKKTTASKCPKSKSAKKENDAPLSKPSSISSPAPVTIKIKPVLPKHTTPSSPVLTKPAAHNIGMKRPAWSPPASSANVRSPLSGVTVRSPNQGLRLGLSRLARVKPLHPGAVPH